MSYSSGTGVMLQVRARQQQLADIAWGCCQTDTCREPTRPAKQQLLGRQHAEETAGACMHAMPCHAMQAAKHCLVPPARPHMLSASLLCE